MDSCENVVNVDTIMKMLEKMLDLLLWITVSRLILFNNQTILMFYKHPTRDKISN